MAAALTRTVRSVRAGLLIIDGLGRVLCHLIGFEPRQVENIGKSIEIVALRQPRQLVRERSDVEGSAPSSLPPLPPVINRCQHAAPALR